MSLKILILLNLLSINYQNYIRNSTFNKLINSNFDNSKLVVAHYLYSLAIGGMERGISTILELLSNKNVNSILLTVKQSEKEYNISPKIKRFFTHRKINGDLRLDKKYIKKLIRKYKIGIFVYHNMIGKTANVKQMNKILHKYGVKIINFSHITVIDIRFSYTYKFLSLKGFELYISLVNFNILYYLSIKRINSILVHNLMNFNIGDKLPDYYPNKNILIVGRPIPFKNYEYIIDVFSEVVKKIKDAKLQIIGFLRPYNKNYINKILRKIKDLKLEKNTIVTGISKNISSFYKNSSIYISSSFYEGSPNVISEAKSHGLATVVVGTTYVTPANNGTININEYDKNKTKYVLIKLLSNNTYLQEMRQFAFNNRFEKTNQEIVDIWIKIYKKLLTNNKLGIKILELNSNDYSTKKYLELDKMMIKDHTKHIKRINAKNKILK